VVDEYTSPGEFVRFIDIGATTTTFPEAATRAVHVDKKLSQNATAKIISMEARNKGKVKLFLDHVNF
jgi:hypothetical protein